MTEEQKAFVLSHKDKPIVGLIHKDSKEIILAPCIPKKVCLYLNDAGEASGGYLMKDGSAIDSAQLDEFNALLKKNHLPRLARIGSSIKEISAHEFLFTQKGGSTERSQWGGFTLELTSSDELKYTFASGCF